VRQLISLTTVFIIAGTVSSLADTSKVTDKVKSVKSTTSQVASPVENVQEPPFLSVDDFLQKMAGKYSGKGVAEITGSKADKILCKVENVFDDKRSELVLSGNCASVKGKKAVTGKITHVGGKLSGALMTGANVEITKSFGAIVKDKLVLTTYAFNNKTGKLSKMRQEISHTKTGISTIFYSFNNKQGKYQKVGNLNLKRL